MFGTTDTIYLQNFYGVCFRNSKFLRGTNEGRDRFHQDDTPPTQAFSPRAQGTVFLLEVIASSKFMYTNCCLLLVGIYACVLEGAKIGKRHTY